MAKCGIFYFLKPSEAITQSLVEFLGDYYNFLQEISLAIGNELYNRPMPQKVNWKLIIENVLECYHCKTVHANSFVLQGYGVAQPDTFRQSAKHNDCEYPKVAPKSENTKAGKLSFLKYRVRQNEVFHHTLIYPNMVISITEGSSYYIGNVIPVSANESILNVRIHAPKLIIPEDAPKVSEAMVNAFHEMASDSLITILNEDRMLLENVQSVVAKINREPIFGKDEIRINNFYQSYFSDIEEMK
jgi:phenylpropionate dioxygenase-like ring-hydroxylating dioxygenase large terminal subunit